MKLGLMTWGSDGDIRPVMALAAGLVKAGHQVNAVVASVDAKDYSSIAKSIGVSLTQIPITGPAEIESAGRALSATNNIVRQIRILYDVFFDPFQQKFFNSAAELCLNNNAVIGHHIMTPLKSAAERSRTPHAAIYYCHGLIPSAYRAPDPMPNLGRIFNSLCWKTADIIGTYFLREYFDRTRLTIGLPPSKPVLSGGTESDRLNLVAVSPSIYPEPPDWRGKFHMCGFFNMPESAEPPVLPAGLDEFIRAGEPPVYMTFGSLGQLEPESCAKLLTDAVIRSGRRGIIQSDWERVREIPESEKIFRIGKAPHDAIFPLCRAVVHHGGAGTTQASLRAGVPSVVVAHAFDQYFWGDEMRRLGAGGKTLNRRSVTPEKLARAIDIAVSSEQMREAAGRVGEKMKAEDGVQTAVRLIEKVFVG